LQQRTVFLAVSITLLVWTIVMCVIEPVVLDGWFLVDWHAQGNSFAAYVRSNWIGDQVWSNPRLGQWAMFATYDHLAWHLAITPLFVVATYVLLLVHLRGRWPDPARDGWALLLLVGIAVLGQPQFGVVLFYRPFHANYVIGLALQLAWLVPYRFALERAPGGNAIAKTTGMLVLGVVAGLCNEHTGPALVAATGLACIWLWRQGRLRVWHVVGLVAFTVAFLALVKAPAQATRYCGIGDVPVLQRILARGVVNNLLIVVGLVTGAKWMWLGLAAAWVAVRRRVPLRPAIYWIAIGAVVSVTMLASPKQGGRLLFAAVSFASIGVVLWLEALAADHPRLRAAITLVAVGAIGFALARTVTTTARSAADLDARHATIAAAKPGTVVEVPPLREKASRWFLGDDFDQDSLRHRIAVQHQLTAIDLAGRGMIPYQFAIRYDAGDGPKPLERFVSLNQCEARKAFGSELKGLRARHPNLSAELVIVPREPVFDKPLVSSRWRDGKLVAPSASVVNELRTRYLTIHRGGLEDPFEVTLIGPGKTIKLVEAEGRYAYKPWQNGSYWVIVCADVCYLASTIRHTGL
jgi:hypothetical protein